MPNLEEVRGSYDWEEAFAVATVRSATPWLASLSLTHPTHQDIAEVIAAEDGENDGAHWLGVFRLTDGRYAAVSSWCDYTGWGCQDGGEIMIACSLNDIISFGLSDDERQRLGIPIPLNPELPPAATRDELPPYNPVDRGNGPGED